MSNPLWMPKGSVRSLLALSLVSSFLAAVGYSLTRLDAATLADLTKLMIGSLTTAVGTVVTLYFTKREEESDGKGK